MIEPADDGHVRLRLSLTPPEYTDAMAVLIVRGTLPVDHPVELLLASAPTT